MTIPTNSRFPTGLLLAVLLLGIASTEALGQNARPPTELLPHRQRLYVELGKLTSANKLDQAFATAKEIVETDRAFLAYIEKTFPKNEQFLRYASTNLSLSLRQLANFQRDREEFASAAATGRELLALLVRIYGADYWEVGDARRIVAQAERLPTLSAAQRQELSEAKTLDRQVLQNSEAGRWRGGLPLAEKALAIRERILGADDPETAISVNTLAGLHDMDGDSLGAEPFYRRVLETRGRTLGMHHPAYAGSLNNLGYLYLRMGDSLRAEPFVRQALEVYRESLGDRNPGYASTLGNLASIYYEQGNFHKAAPLYEKELKLTGEQFGVNSARYAISLANLAGVYKALEDEARAEPLFQQAVDVRKKVHGEGHPEYATSLNNLAALYYQMGRYDKAEPLYRRALAIRKATVGETHLDYAQSLNNLAALLAAKGEGEQAEPLFRRALAIRRSSQGDTHPLVFRTLANLSLLLAARGRWMEAAQEADQSFRSLRVYASRILPALSERDHLAFLNATYRETFGSSLSLGLARPDDPALARVSADWILNGKGLAQEALMERSLAGRESRDPELADTVKTLGAVRADLASATLEGAEPGHEAEYQQRLSRLNEQEETLAVRIGRSRGLSERGRTWVELEDVRAALPADSVLVEYARFPVFDFQLKGKMNFWREPHYAAWIIPALGQGDVRLFDLGLAEPTDETLGAFRQAIRNAPATIDEKGEPAAEAEIKLRLAAVSERVLRPLEPVLSHKTRWLISPDASLWLVPWGALILKDGSYCLQRHTINYLTSGRELVARSGSTAASKGGLMVADPDFDLAAIPRQDASPARASRSSSVPLPTDWPRLAGTAEEAETVLPKVERYLRVRPALYTGPEATESRFKAARQPRVVVLSTHGFFLKDQDLAAPPPVGAAGRGIGLLGTASSPPRPKGAGDEPARPFENPLLRCGLVFAGANQREHATDPQGDDGVLTGLEIAGTDLRGTEIVVLSACETGLGVIRNGDGVAGLRQAFQMAGARDVVASLWQIPDEATARLMSRFWDELAAGKDPGDALHEAQLTLIRERLETEKAAHPYFWAAFTLTGSAVRKH